jgi:hypothetical protein
MISKETANQLLHLYQDTLEPFQDSVNNRYFESIKLALIAIKELKKECVLNWFLYGQKLVSRNPQKALQQLVSDKINGIFGLEYYFLRLISPESHFVKLKNDKELERMHSLYRLLSRQEMSIVYSKNAIYIHFPSTEWCTAFFKELYREEYSHDLKKKLPNNDPLTDMDKLAICFKQETNATNCKLFIDFQNPQTPQNFKILFRHAPKAISVKVKKTTLCLSAKKDISEIFSIRIGESSQVESFQILAPAEVCLYKSAALMDALYITRMLGQVLRGKGYKQFPPDVIVKVISWSINNMLLKEKAIRKIVKNNLYFRSPKPVRFKEESVPTGLPSINGTEVLKEEKVERGLLVNYSMVEGNYYNRVTKDDKYVYFHFLDEEKRQYFLKEVNKPCLELTVNNDQYIVKIPITKPNNGYSVFSIPYYELMTRNYPHLCLPRLLDIAAERYDDNKEDNSEPTKFDNVSC